MKHPHVLVVYYSLTGTTKKMAELLGQFLSCDLEPIEETDVRSGVWGYARSLFEAAAHTAPEIAPAKRDPAHYEMVILATPTWMGQMSSPMRTYVLQKGARFRNVAFLTTCGTVWNNRVFSQLQALCRKAPIAQVSLTAREIASTRHLRKLEHFAAKITATLEKAPPQTASELKHAAS